MAMSLLTMEHVTRRFQRGSRELVALDDVSLQIEPGELVAVWGLRRSGRTTLLRVAAGLERPEDGVVRFEGRDLATFRDRVLGAGIGYCQMCFSSAEGGAVLDHVAAGPLAQGLSLRLARRRAGEPLERVGARVCADCVPHELSAAETVRVAIARVLVLAPRLVTIDDPTNGVDPLERDPLLGLLRSVSNDGAAVLMTTGDTTAVSAVDRALSIDEGRLRGDLAPTNASVIPLRRPPSPPGARSGAQPL